MFVDRFMSIKARINYLAYVVDSQDYLDADDVNLLKRMVIECDDLIKSFFAEQWDVGRRLKGINQTLNTLMEKISTDEYYNTSMVYQVDRINDETNSILEDLGM